MEKVVGLLCLWGAKEGGALPGFLFCSFLSRPQAWLTVYVNYLFLGLATNTVP